MSGSMTRVTATEPFSYSVDGFTQIRVQPGETPEIPTALVQGLRNLGKIAKEGEEPKVETQTLTLKLDATDAVKTIADAAAALRSQPTGEPPAQPPASPPPGLPDVEIPEDWQKLHHMRLIVLAKQIDDTATTKDAAVAAIEAYLAAKAAAQAA